MVAHPPVLIAPDTFGADLRAPAVAAAIARGLERAGVTPLAELCPVSSGGAGTIEVLLPALGGETRDGFALIEDGGTALVELEDAGALTGERLAAAAASGAAVVLLAAAGAQAPDAGDAGDALLAALAEHGGLGATALVVLCDVRAPGALAERLRDERRRPPRGRRAVRARGARASTRACAPPARWSSASGASSAAPCRAASRARSRRVRASPAFPATPSSRVDAIDRFDARILDLQTIIERHDDRRARGRRRSARRPALAVETDDLPRQSAQEPSRWSGSCWGRSVGAWALGCWPLARSARAWAVLRRAR